MREEIVEENGEQRPVVTKDSSIPAMPIQNAARARLARMTASVLAFASACAAATGARHAGVTYGGVRARHPMIVRTPLSRR